MEKRDNKLFGLIFGRGYLQKGLCAVVGLGLMASCAHRYDFEINRKEEATKEIDTGFHFDTHSELTIKVTVTNAIGAHPSGVRFSIFTQEPYEDMVDGNGENYCRRRQGVLPVYQGSTEGNGSLTVAMNLSVTVSKLYIVPETPGYGDMQVVALADGLKTMSVELTDAFRLTDVSSAKSLRKGVSSTRIADRDGEGTCVGTNYKFYSYYTDDEFTKNIDGTTSTVGRMNHGHGMVEYENLPAQFVNTACDYFPEGQTNYSGETETNFHMKEDGEMWVTMISEGVIDSKTGEHNDHLGLYYYIYTDDNVPNVPYGQSLRYSDEYRLTAVFPDANPKVTPTGTKVQLMYYNKNTGKYQAIFPKGTYVGFALLRDGYHNSKGEYKYSFGFAPYCSNKKFNDDKLSHSVVFYSNSYDSYIVGLENLGQDNDFNDVICKVKVNPVQELTGMEAPVDIPLFSVNSEGTLAFEDNWPKKGDYDFNDFVTRYSYSLIKESDTNRIKSIKLSFSPQAIGASNTNGFGIILPVSTSRVKAVTGATLESDETLATLIVYNDVREAYDGRIGMINTILGSERVESTTKEVVVELTEPINEAEVNTKNFNPFIFTSKRSHEIHLADYPFTSKMDKTMLNQVYDDDCTVPDKGIYFRANNQYPWALDISSIDWQWPYEGLLNGISAAYPLYDEWYKMWQGGQATDWISKKEDSYLWKAK